MVRLIIIVFAMLSFSCSSQPTAPEQSAKYYATKIIVGFQAPQTNPDNPKLIKYMAGELDARIEFVRLISGNAAVYKVSSTQTDIELSAKLKQLNQHDDVRYAELDSRQTTQQHKKNDK